MKRMTKSFTVAGMAAFKGMEKLFVILFLQERKMPGGKI